jgi:hypothetical protein
MYESDEAYHIQNIVGLYQPEISLFQERPIIP